jgi:hypothetical protein
MDFRVRAVATRIQFQWTFQPLTAERDTGVEPATFSLGKRKRPFRAVTGSGNQLKTLIAA